MRSYQNNISLNLFKYFFIMGIFFLTFTNVCFCADTGMCYEPTWDSVTRHPDPTWFADAKFGIYFHWGVYSVPAFKTEWYSHYMYVEGHACNKHHLEKYGSLKDFGYKDFIPMFKAEKFDADEWAELFKKSGARFAGPVAEHADGFAMWDSELTEWNAMDMGPKRDIVGAMEKAIRKQGLKFITTFHHQWLWRWYPTDDDSTDASNPAYEGLYGPSLPESAWHYTNPKPLYSKTFQKLWHDKIIEVIDKYKPDLLWFDNKMNHIDDSYKTDFLSYYYNRASEWGREVGVTYKKTDLEKGAGILDLERGRMSKLTDFIWLNDDSIDWNSWCDVENPDYKSTNRLIDGLVDIVSKNGNLLLNITPRANGEIPDAVKQRLLEMGEWLKINGEAIYGSRPWQVFGEGPTKVAEGHFGERKIKEFTASDIRFTTKDNALYAICLDWPGDKLTIKLLGSTIPFLTEKISSIKLLGSDDKIKWLRHENGLTLQMPQTKPCQYAYSFKINFEN